MRSIVFGFFLSLFLVSPALAATKVFQVDTDGTLTTSLVSYYNFESSTDDFYGSQTGTASNVTFVAGKVSTSSSFNGSTSKVDLPTNADTYNPVSFSFWLKTSDTSDEVPLFFSNSGGTAIMYFRKSFTTANKLDFIIANGVSDTIITSTTSVTSGAWFHIVVTRNGATATLYVNGVQEDTDAGMHNLSVGSDSRSMGYFRFINALYYTGQLDELGIWDKVLSAQEISDLYNGGSGQTMEYYVPDTIQTYILGLLFITLVALLFITSGVFMYKLLR